MREQTEREAIEAAETYLRPPDEPHGGGGDEGPDRYAEARYYLRDAIDYLAGREIDPEEAIRCAREAIARIEAEL